MIFRQSNLAHKYLDGLEGLEIGGSAHNPFGLNTRNVDYTDAMDTVFKLEEKAMCGEALPVDIVAPGDDLPLPDKSVDFVISSHVIEHFWDPIGAIREWERVARRYIFIICPKRDALESDRDKPITSWGELLDRHVGAIPAPNIDTHEHYTRWTVDTFLAMCANLGLRVVDHQPTDDKAGNGFTVVIDLQA